MTFFSKAGAFNTGTAAAGNTVVVSDVGFTPKVVLFWWAGTPSGVDAVQRLTHRRGFGVAVSPTDRRCMGSLAEDTPTSMNTNSAQHNAACIIRLDTDGTTSGLMDLQSFDTDTGFTLIVDEQFSA